jgi:chromate transporter
MTNMILLWQIFILFTRVAMFSWGGGPASLALMQRETTSATWTPPGKTEAVPWITPDEFADAVALGNAIPGPIAPQVSAYVGFKLAGLPGAVSAAVGTVIPTTLLMLIMVVLFFGVKESGTIKAMLKAVRPVVVGLLLWTAYDMANTVFDAKTLGWGQAFAQGWDKLLFVGATFVLLTFTKVNPAIIVLCTAILGYIFYR